MATTYQDFITAATNANRLNEFSQSDLELAKKYPEFGSSILNLKNQYAAAQTDEDRQSANDAANRLRSSYGAYTGAQDGSQHISDGLAANQALDKQNALAAYGPFAFESPYTQALNDALNNLQSMGSFTWEGTAPTYTNQYAATQKELLDKILNRDPFSYDKNQDPQWAAYKKEYLREGDRAAANALGQAAAASGGRPSSYAQTAATQAGDYYAGQLADIIPTLYQQAYDRYLQEYSMKQQDLAAVNNQEQLDYSKYLTDLGQYNTDRSFALDAFNANQSNAQNMANLLASLDNQAYNQAYNTWSGNYDLLANQYGTLRGQADSEYNYYLDQLDRAAAQEQAQQTLYQGMVDAMLQTGTMPSMDLLGQSGYNQEYATALATYYQNKLAEEVKKTGGGNGGGTQKAGYEQLVNDMLAAGITTEAKAKAYLLSLGYNSTTAAAYAKAFMEDMEGQKNAAPITDVSQLGATALSIANQMSKSNSTAHLGTLADKIKAALASGSISEGEADFLLRAMGY